MRPQQRFLVLVVIRVVPRRTRAGVLVGMVTTRRPRSGAVEVTDLDPRGVEILRSQLDGALHDVLRSNDPDYEDVLQSAFEQILCAIRRREFRGEGSLAGWARAIARNVAVDRVRARSREQRVFADEDVELAAEHRSTAVSPDRLAHARRELGQFVMVLSKLRRGKAQVVYLHDVLGHDLAEVARAMGISVAAAQSRLVRGRCEVASRMTCWRGPPH
jgi:RNA polymerase sigma-70 factor (ECF subfamily)